MKLPRRLFLKLAAGSAALPVLSCIASAEAYPTRPVQIIHGFAPGGGADIIARLVSQWLFERLGQPFAAESRPGDATNVATEAVVRAPADGYALLLATSPNAANATLYPKLNFNFIGDIAPVAGLIRVPYVMEVNPLVPVKTVPEFIAYTKANPGKVNMASAGIGVPGHMSCELFKMLTGVNMLHIPYRGSAPALTDLLGGQVQVMFDPMPSSIGYITTGQLRALAVTSAKRMDALQDIPTVGEFVTGYEASLWNGFGAPKGPPAEIIEKLNKQINAGLNDTKMKARLVDLGATVLAGSPADIGNLIAEDTEKWAKVIRAANIKPE